MSMKTVVVGFIFLCTLSALAVAFIYSSSAGSKQKVLVAKTRSAIQTDQQLSADVDEVISALSAPGHPGTDTASETDVTRSRLNPGCIAKKLNKYRAVNTGRVYHHPPIIHYAKLSHSASRVSLNFREYTSVLSVFKFLQPQQIFFHVYTGTSIGGKYWDIIKGWDGVQVNINVISPVSRINGKYVPYIQHEADYVKLREVYHHGGIAMDFDVVIVNATRLRYEQQLSECVLSEEGEYINGGFYSCIKASPYLEKWLKGYDTDYKPDLWLHNVSYKPRDLLIDPHSSVCYNVYLDNTICIHPNWGKQKEWLGSGVVWQAKTAAHYFVKKGIHNDGEALLKENHSLAKLLQFVHKA